LPYDFRQEYSKYNLFYINKKKWWIAKDIISVPDPYWVYMIESVSIRKATKEEVKSFKPLNLVTIKL
jgi:hypothetical protein